ncbi:MAG: hypothetical protein HWN68_08325 [Desulfobacterales bacterium]|nr:hypothetical protein [Desulfobacterales bacterium]
MNAKRVLIKWKDAECKRCRKKLTEEEKKFNFNRVGGYENPLCFNCAKVALTAIANWLADLMKVVEGEPK